MILLLSALLLTAPAMAGGEPQETLMSLIRRNGSQPAVTGSPDYFTGRVRIENSFSAGTPSSVQGAVVTFEPGARTAWHTHPRGQTLIVLSGLGWIQRENGPVEEIRPGDTVWFAAGERHWHGASATTGMSHIALQEAEDGKVVDWLEHVTDQQYQGGPERH